MKHIFLSLVVFSSLSLAAQEATPPVFTPPFDAPLSFSGNFGEIRATHFHGGLDFRTGGAVNKRIRALADGYISRVRVNHGSGYIVEVTYDNGYRTINRHLEGLLPPFAALIEQLQYEQESYEVDFIPGVNEYRVKRGEAIGLSGNRGYSFGPHLHLDVIDVDTEDYVDPIPLFGKAIVDTTAPKAFGFQLIPQVGRGVVNNKPTPTTFTPEDKSVVRAWGEVGAAIKAYDFINGSLNKCGVHTVQLYVDGELVHQSVIDRFSYEESRQVNSWSHEGYMRSFVLPGNNHRMFETYNGNRGIVTIDEPRDYRFQYVLTDVAGNSTRYQFTVRGQEMPIDSVDTQSRYYVSWNRTHVVNDPGVSLVIPQEALHQNQLLNYQIKPDTSGVAYTYQLHDKALSLFKPAQLQIGLRHRPVADSTKYYIARVTPKGKSSVGGSYADGFVKADIRTLGTYTVAIDTVPPVITPVEKPNWTKNSKLLFTIADKQTGISHYRATIDGKYVLLYRPNMMQSRYICKLNPKYVEKGKKHTLEVIAVDGCGNETVYRDTFVW